MPATNTAIRTPLNLERTEIQPRTDDLESRFRDKAGTSASSPTLLRALVLVGLAAVLGVVALGLFSGRPGAILRDPHLGREEQVLGGAHEKRFPRADRADPPIGKKRDDSEQPKTATTKADRPAASFSADSGGAASPTSIPVGIAGSDLARQAHRLLKKYCDSCHGSTFKVPGYDVLDREVLVATPPAGKKRKAPYVVPGKPDASLLWKRVGIEEDMPPDESPLPSDAERALLKRWIEAGAPFPENEAPRRFVGEKAVLTAIRAHLETVPSGDRRFHRYFTLANLHNNRKVLDDDLRLTFAALSKLANSLSWKSRIVVPRAIDRDATVVNVDLRDLGWDENDLWKAIVRQEEPPEGTKFLGARDLERKGYPYGLRHHRFPADEALQALAREVAQLTGSEFSYIRADWFVATASRPPIYETVLGLPANARDLERRLGVDVRANFLRDRLARAAFASSGVSSHNRMVERHDQGTSDGAYWKSYDFGTDEGTAALASFPLGPVFDGNPFARQAFEHAGGEIIFHLPNKLQAYLLINNRDDRIEEGPIGIVGDSLQTSGTATIINGLSCMGCHKEGMIGGFADAIRAGNALAGEAREKVVRLYPPKGVMDDLLAGDSEAFLAAEEKAMGSFLKVGADRDKSIRDFAEPIGAIARRYVKELGLEEVAAELGIEKPEVLRAKIESSPVLRRLGLGPLLQPEGRIKRAAWESLQSLNSPFQESALELELGTPHHEL